MNRPSKKLKVSLVMIVFALSVAMIYIVALPELIASQYNTRVRTAANSLRENYVELEESTEQALINDPTATSSDQIQAVEQLRGLLRENRISLERFSSVANDYQPLPYTGYTIQTSTAHALQAKSLAFIEQSNGAFAKYSELIDFIKNYDATAKTVAQYVTDFNATPDLNIYEGQANLMYGIADSIRADVRTFDIAKTPHEARGFKTASVQAFTQVADGFEGVGLGLQIPADDVIYGNARQIEAVDQIISGPNQTLYERDVLSSRTIKSIQDLREKLDLILP
ncbi:MAG TPA: hypothetical protein VGO98_01650 [Candidatus Saccharimonadales bacterium]|jgi:hypothetical protein|nr:hypothetical protein [Candidatus Saccharimonadales bacterium]